MANELALNFVNRIDSTQLQNICFDDNLSIFSRDGTSNMGKFTISVSQSQAYANNNVPPTSSHVLQVSAPNNVSYSAILSELRLAAKFGLVVLLPPNETLSRARQLSTSHSEVVPQSTVSPDTQESILVLLTSPADADAILGREIRVQETLVICERLDSSIFPGLRPDETTGAALGVQVFAVCGGAVDGVECGTILRASLGPQLQTLSQFHAEYILQERVAFHKTTHLWEEAEGEFGLERADVMPQRTKVDRKSMPIPPGFLSEGAMMVLMRLMARNEKEELSLRFPSLDDVGECIVQLDQTVNDLQPFKCGEKDVPCVALKRQVFCHEECKSSWDLHFLSTGQLLEWDQLGGPITIRVADVPSPPAQPLSRSEELLKSFGRMRFSQVFPPEDPVGKEEEKPVSDKEDRAVPNNEPDTLASILTKLQQSWASVKSSEELHTILQEGLDNMTERGHYGSAEHNQRQFYSDVLTAVNSSISPPDFTLIAAVHTLQHKRFADVANEEEADTTEPDPTAAPQESPQNDDDVDMFIGCLFDEPEPTSGAINDDGADDTNTTVSADHPEASENEDDNMVIGDLFDSPKASATPLTDGWALPSWVAPGPPTEEPWHLTRTPLAICAPPPGAPSEGSMPAWIRGTQTADLVGSASHGGVIGAWEAPEGGAEGRNAVGSEQHKLDMGAWAFSYDSELEQPSLPQPTIEIEAAAVDEEAGPAAKKRSASVDSSASSIGLSSLFDDAMIEKKRSVDAGSGSSQDGMTSPSNIVSIELDLSTPFSELTPIVKPKSAPSETSYVMKSAGLRKYKKVTNQSGKKLMERIREEELSVPLLKLQPSLDGGYQEVPEEPAFPPEIAETVAEMDKSSAPSAEKKCVRFTLPKERHDTTETNADVDSVEHTLFCADSALELNTDTSTTMWNDATPPDFEYVVVEEIQEANAPGEMMETCQSDEDDFEIREPLVVEPMEPLVAETMEPLSETSSSLGEGGRKGSLVVAASSLPAFERPPELQGPDFEGGFDPPVLLLDPSLDFRFAGPGANPNVVPLYVFGHKGPAEEADGLAKLSDLASAADAGKESPFAVRPALATDLSDRVRFPPRDRHADAVVHQQNVVKSLQTTCRLRPEAAPIINSILPPGSPAKIPEKATEVSNAAVAPLTSQTSVQLPSPLTRLATPPLLQEARRLETPTRGAAAGPPTEASVQAAQSLATLLEEQEWPCPYCAHHNVIADHSCAHCGDAAPKQLCATIIENGSIPLYSEITAGQKVQALETATRPVVGFSANINSRKNSNEESLHVHHDDSDDVIELSSVGSLESGEGTNRSDFTVTKPLMSASGPIMAEAIGMRAADLSSSIALHSPGGTQLTPAKQRMSWAPLEPSHLHEKFEALKASVGPEVRAYLEAHTETRELLAEFVHSLLIAKPSNVVDFASKYFFLRLIDRKAAET